MHALPSREHEDLPDVLPVVPTRRLAVLGPNLLSLFAKQWLFLDSATPLLRRGVHDPEDALERFATQAEAVDIIVPNGSFPFDVLDATWHRSATSSQLLPAAFLWPCCLRTACSAADMQPIHVRPVELL